MNDKIKQFIVFGVCSVVALVLCLGVLVVTVNNLDSDINAVENKTITDKTELDSSKETLVSYINNIVADTSDKFVKTKTYTDVSVCDLKVLNSENQSQDEGLFNFAKDKMLPLIDGYYAKDSEGTFEKDDSKKINLVLNEKMIENSNFSIGQVNENGESVFDDEGNLVDEEFYYLTYEICLDIESDRKFLFDMFSLKEDSLAKEKFIKDIKAECRVNNFDAEFSNITIKAKVNRESDELEYINVIRKYFATIDVEFINDAELFGKKRISFIYTVTDTYEYSYAGISFVENEVLVGVDNEYMLNVNAVIDDDSEYTVEFSSSDEDVATVDEMGYVKVLKNSDVPVIITVKLSYLGETFTDTCVVNVSED